jgi:hypothetical protein
VPLALAFAVALSAPASARAPFVAMSPSVGKPKTTFRLSIPKRLAKRPRGYGLQVDFRTPKGQPRACSEPWTTPKPHTAGAYVVLRFKPSQVGTFGHWCPGKWRVLVYAEKVVDDNDQTGAGGVVQKDLVRSSFRVRR